METGFERCEQCKGGFKPRGYDLNDWTYHFCSKKCWLEYAELVEARIAQELCEHLPPALAHELANEIKDEPLYKLDFLARRMRKILNNDD